ncbi:uncharacterized protein LOC125423709 [Ziziphus jujuba]|uniref:Uncharacterized protein LOC125423709 n=1 Tax=Ziziphus jujuba TaxID=326968 RepID=A0ABM4ADH3_ZIZJJ|nr:uncharacterized protein LOC125423709 [Ziziphus jujuba]XP_060674764.1 uncharacterized protein LOC125423709 [Ziziphus jujuba]
MIGNKNNKLGCAKPMNLNYQAMIAMLDFNLKRKKIKIKTIKFVKFVSRAYEIYFVSMCLQKGGPRLAIHIHIHIYIERFYGQERPDGVSCGPEAKPMQNQLFLEEPIFFFFFVCNVCFSPERKINVFFLCSVCFLRIRMQLYSDGLDCRRTLHVYIYIYIYIYIESFYGQDRSDEKGAVQKRGKLLSHWITMSLMNGSDYFLSYVRNNCWKFCIHLTFPLFISCLACTTFSHISGCLKFPTHHHELFTKWCSQKARLDHFKNPLTISKIPNPSESTIVLNAARPPAVPYSGLKGKKKKRRKKHG